MSSPRYDTRYPGIADLKRKAKKRIPNFAFDYVNAGIDDEIGKQRNRQAFHEIELTPRYLTDVRLSSRTFLGIKPQWRDLHTTTPY